MRWAGRLGLAAAMGSAACGTVWDLSGSGSLQRDVAAVLSAHGVTATPECHFLGTTRNGVCTLSAPRSETDGLIAGLGLRAASARALPAGWEAWASPTGCRAQAGFGVASSVEVHTSARRDPALPGWEFWILLREPGTDRVCLEVGYAYG